MTNILIETLLLSLATASWIIFALSNILYRKKNTKLPKIIAIIAIVIQLAWTTFRVWQSGYAPFSGAYESMVFFSFIFGIKLIFLSRWKTTTQGYLSIPIVLMLTAAVFLPSHLKTINILVPALQSPWIFIHVPSFFIGYVSLVIAFVLSIGDTFGGADNDISRNISLNSEIKLAFFFITLGIITGAFWGEQAWGNFWSWDPKELWALITWLLLIIYFHIRNKTTKFVLITVAFLAMLFTYFGVMFLLSGLHSYI
jgi:ABC-type transport system involved in cytochrome c biogenesis permease subunit